MAGYITLTPVFKPCQVDPIDIFGYDGNFRGINCDSPSIELQEGYYLYFIDLSELSTALISIDSTDFGFSSTIKGGSIRIGFTLPNSSISVTFDSNIKFADYEEIDYWESGKTYYLELITNNGGTTWVVTEVEVY